MTGNVLLDDALAGWRATLGAEHVRSDPPELVQLFPTTMSDAPQPLAVLRPADREQAQSAVRIAGRHGIPLYPISRGRNWGYGDARPPAPGQVVLDLGRLNRIVEINEEMAYAVIEPGVSQGQFSRALAERGGRLWMDATGAGPEASIVGNTLDRGFGHTAYGERSRQVCGLEIILPDGNLLRTGTGHYRDSQTGALYRDGVGPALDGLFFQSGFGVVTRMTVWLQPRPEYFCAFFLVLQDESGLGGAIDALRKLKLEGSLRSVIHIANDLRMISTKGGAFWGNAAGAKRGGWGATGAIYGDRRQAAATRARVRRILAGPGRRLVFLDDAKLALGEKVAGLLGTLGLAQGLRDDLAQARPAYDLLKGNPVGHYLRGAYWRRREGLGEPPLDPARDGAGLLWLSPLLPATGSAARDYCRLAHSIFQRHGLDFMVTFSFVSDRSLGAVTSISFDRNDPGECRRAQDCYDALLSETQKAGYISYRAGIQAMPRLDQGSDGFWPVVRRLKAAIDPQNIIAPGRYDPAAARGGLDPFKDRAGD